MTHGKSKRKAQAAAMQAVAAESSPIQVGDTVRLKSDTDEWGPTPRSGVVTSLLGPDIPGGLFIADGLRGCRYWNVLDVVRVRCATS